MAEIKIIELEFTTKGYEQALSDLTQTNEEIRKLQESNRQLAKAIKDGNDENGEFARKLSAQKAQIKELRKDSRTYENQVNSTANSVAGWRAEMRELNRQMEQVDQSTEEGRAELQRLGRQYTEVKRKVDDYDKSLGRNQSNVGNYEASVKSAIKSVGAMFAAIGAGIAVINRLSSSMQESIQLFAEQEQAEKRLEFAAGGAADALKAQAAAIQANSKFGDEAIIGQQAYLASLGFTEKQIKDMIQASVDLSAASGMNLDSAVRNLAKTYSGLTGELGESLPMLRGLTSEQLKAGEATRLIGERFAGFAANEAATLTGRLDQLKNDYNDLREEMGEKYLPVQFAITEAKYKMLQALLDVINGTSKYMGIIKIAAAGILGYTVALAVMTAASIKARIAQLSLNLAVLRNPYVLAAGFITALVAAIAIGIKNFIEWADKIDLTNRLAEFFSRTLSKVTDGLQTGIGFIAKMAEGLGMKGLSGAFSKLNNMLGNASKSLDEYADRSEAARIEDQKAAEAKRELYEQMDRQVQRSESLLASNVKLKKAANDGAFATRQEAQATYELLNAQRQRLVHELRLLEAHKKRVKEEGNLADKIAYSNSGINAQIQELRFAIAGTKDAQEAARDWVPEIEAGTAAIEGQTAAIERQRESVATLTDIHEAAIAINQQAREEARKSLELTDDYTGSVEKLTEATLEEIALRREQAIRAAQFAEQTEKAIRGISWFNMDNNQILATLTAMGDELERQDMILSSIAASYNIANDAINVRFQNQRNQIEETAMAEQQAIEDSTLSEEQKRVRIERSEQKKALELDKLDRKQRRTQKARDIIQSIINTALAITKALPNPFLVAFAAATGAAQTATIAAQQFAEGGQVLEGNGGKVGPSNIATQPNGDSVLTTLKPGEVVLNAAQQSRLYNRAGRGIFKSIGVPGFAQGGAVPGPQMSDLVVQPNGELSEAANSLRATAQKLQVTLSMPELNRQQVRLQNVENEGQF